MSSQTLLNLRFLGPSMHTCVCTKMPTSNGGMEMLAYVYLLEVLLLQHSYFASVKQPSLLLNSPFLFDTLQTSRLSLTENFNPVSSLGAQAGGAGPM